MRTKRLPADARGSDDLPPSGSTPDFTAASSATADSSLGGPSLTAVFLSVLLVYLTLLFPAHPAAFNISTLLRFPLELPVIVLLLLMIRPGAARWLGGLLVLTLGLLLLLRLADLGSLLAFNRRFSPLLELHLLADGWNLASTAIGPVEAMLVVLLMLTGLGLLAGLLYRGLLTIAHSRGRSQRMLYMLCAGSLIVAATVLISGRTGSAESPVTASTAARVEARVFPEFRQRLRSLLVSIQDQRAFVSELQADPVLDTAQPTFAALHGRDVILIFVESYGRGYLDAERFAAGARQRLLSTAQTLDAAGLGSRSAWLRSPVRGGRSWLAQATLQSGLEIDNQARFDRLISTDRVSISRLFQQAGWHTVGIMPAIQLAWPEGSWYGYDSLYVNADLGYAGERFGYVTMPDQYTLSHFEQAIRHESAEPVMATIALLSTHAPWTPLPRKLDWESIGDGSIYDGSHRFGEPISWKYRKQVQEMYALSFDYTLQVLGEYAARHADDALIILVGDHQPPPIINGWGESADVPIHVISRDQDLLQRLPELQWSDGMLPDTDKESQAMSTLRKSLATLFE